MTKSSSTKPKTAESPRDRTIAPTRGIENPYDKDTMKHQCFAHFCAGGARSEVVGRMTKTGVTPGTASNWLSRFRKLVAAQSCT
jgi:hypothetical protein